MVLPEIGGRIQSAQDKTNGYDFFYHHNVIKPALVGLAGPWISGGIEFNWPQHHRPATFMPVDYADRRARRTARATVWCGDNDPMNRMKGMHGICLHPGKAFLEAQGARCTTARRSRRHSSGGPTSRRACTTIPVVLPAGCRLCRRPRQARDEPRSRAATAVLRRGLRDARTVCLGGSPEDFVPARRYPANDLSWYPQHPRADRTWPSGPARIFRRVRSRTRGRSSCSGEPSHRARQETVDLGKPRFRVRLGPQPDG